MTSYMNTPVHVCNTDNIIIIITMHHSVWADQRLPNVLQIICNNQ